MTRLSGRKISRLALAMILFAGVFTMTMTPQTKKAGSQPARNEFKRPTPKGPMTPEMPSQNRYQQDKVFLEQADSLYRLNTFEDIKIVKGNVKFRQGGMFMYCDSAYFYSEQDRADCFGHVRMEQGDTLFIYADKLYYDGVEQLAKLRCGPTQKPVILINGKDTLITDSLDYSLMMRLGWYETGGELKDESIRLTSLYGQYSPRTKDAEFFYDVVLVNLRDKYRLLSDTLYYNTDTHIARIDSRTIIEGENDTIITTGGTYNAETGVADLTRRSLIMHRDSNQNVVTLEGDSIIYDRDTEISYAYSFNGLNKRSQPVVLTDTANKSILIGGYGFYDNRTRRSMATDYPMLMEYSRADTLFLRADTIRTTLMREEAVLDSLGNVEIEATEYYIAKAYDHARFFRTDIQGVADSITFIEKDSMLYMDRKPVIWSGERQVNGKIIEVHLNDSTADWARLPDSGMMMEAVAEDFFNQLSGKKMLATLGDNTLKRLEVEGNVMVVMLPQEEDSTYNKLVKAESSFLDATFAEGDIEKLKMWPEVNGFVTPIADVKESDKMLPGANWLVAIRPEREWYGDKAHWADGLGEITDELEAYFAEFHPSVPHHETTSVENADDIEAVEESDEIITTPGEEVEESVESESEIVITEETKESGKKVEEEIIDE